MSKHKDVHLFNFSTEWKDAPIHFSWSGATFLSIKDAKKTLKSLKQAIKQAKKNKK